MSTIVLQGDAPGQEPVRRAGASAKIIRSTGVLAAATGVSRVLGFVRDLLLARLFGTTAQAEAFVVAFRLPNLLRDLVAEGAVTSAFVPILSEYRAKGQWDEFWHVSYALLTRLMVILSLIGLAGVFAAEWIVRITAPGFIGDPDRFFLTVRLTQLLFPFVVLVGFWAFFMGLLNSLRHFTVPALGPAILNVAMIAACVWWVPRVEPGILAVALAVMIGGVVQLVIQLPVAARLGFRWRWQWQHPAMRRTFTLLGPRIVGAAVYQGNVLVHTALASLSVVVGTGAVAALYFANRLVQLPLALFGTASAQASLPSLSEQAAHKDWPAFRATLVGVMRMVGFVILPATAGLLALATPIVRGLFERGAFQASDTVVTAQALMFYTLGLWSYAVSKVLSGAFYALQDTRTPVRLAIEAVLVNIALSLALMWPMRVNGLALSAALANGLNALRLLRAMERRLGCSILEPLRVPTIRTALAASAMGALCWALARAPWVSAHPWVGLGAVIAAGLLAYAAACWVLRVEEFGKLLRWTLRRG